MRRGLVVLGGAALLVAGVYVYLTSAPERREARALADLPRRALAPMLTLDSGPPDLILIENGFDNWYEVNTEALPRGLEIGFHGPRFLDALTGNTHIPLYCSETGKIIWVIQHAQIARDFAFCANRRMDLSPVLPYATPVQLVTEQRTRAEIETLIPTIDADPDRAMVARPEQMSPYSQQVTLTPPLMWFSSDEGPPRHEVEAAIEGAITDHMGPVAVLFRRRPDTNPNLALPPGEDGDHGGGANMVMQRDGGYIVLPRMWAEPYAIRIECNPEACARAQTLDLDAVFALGRDFDRLRRAMASVTVPARSDPPTPLDDFPSLSDLEDDSVRISAPAPVTYQIRYITRP